MTRKLLIKKFLCRIFLMLSGMVALLLTSCVLDNGEDVQLSGLGAEKNEYIVSTEAGSADIKVFANHYTEVCFAEETDWAILLTDHLKGDGVFTVAYDENTSFRRMAKIYLHSPETKRSDSVYLKQEGALKPVMAFKITNTSILSAGGLLQAELETNIDRSLMDITVTYTNEEGETDWIQDDFSIENGIFSFSVDRNTSETEIRNAKITIVFIDGWEEEVSSELYIIQANAQDLFGIEASFEEVRSWEGVPAITEGIYLEGYVVSNPDSKNVADNTQTSPTRIDYTPNDRTAYIQSLDGKYGFRIVTATVADNIFRYKNRVQLLLKGTTVVLDENPSRYTISGVTSNMLTFSTNAASEIPVKEKYMGELTDDDIYTYVTLKDCEFPIRKGGMTPIHEGYAYLFSQNRIMKYPLLMRDIQGNSMYMLTNVHCPYRRDGRKLPFGSGTVAGVIVHETCTNFEYEDTDDEDTYGQIGRYQIRHTRYEDINMLDDMPNSFSALLTEYRYPNRANGNSENRPTTGTNGRMTCSAGNFTVGADMSYLGPCGPTILGDQFNGNGGTGIDEPGSYNSAGTNTDGNGQASQSSWGVGATSIWWNETFNRGHAFIIEFSTAGISTTQLSMQISVINQVSSVNWGDGGGSARFWKAEWSEHGDMSGVWNTIAYYTVPDYPNWSNTQIFQSTTFKYINIPLPLTMLGKNIVYIRLMVDRNIGSDGYRYANVPIAPSINSRLNYFAIRYNK